MPIATPRFRSMKGDPFIVGCHYGTGDSREIFQASVNEFDAVVGSSDFVFANDTVDADEPAGDRINL